MTIAIGQNQERGLFDLIDDWLKKDIFESLSRFSKVIDSQRLKSALPYLKNFTGYTKIYFAEKQLSLGLISLSLLTSSHLNLFQQIRVRSSNTCFHEIFNLLKVRSPSFGSYIYYY
jgi:hypothetical protein